MKKFIITISFLLAVIFIVGCGNNPAKIDEKTNTLNLINTNIDNIITTLNNIEEPESTNLIYDSSIQEELASKTYTAKTTSYGDRTNTINQNSTPNLTETKNNNTYKSRYYKENNVSLSSNQSKDDNLRMICKDACSSCNEFKTQKNNLLSNCYNCKNIINDILNNKIEFDDNKVSVLKEYNDTLQNCLNNLQTCTNSNNNLNKINKYKVNTSANSDSLYANYLNLTNNMDMSINCCKSINLTLNEVVNLLNNKNTSENIMTTENKPSDSIYDYNKSYKENYPPKYNNEDKTNNSSNTENEKQITQENNNFSNRQTLKEARLNRLKAIKRKRFEEMNKQKNTNPYQTEGIDTQKTNSNDQPMTLEEPPITTLYTSGPKKIRA